MGNQKNSYASALVAFACFLAIGNVILAIVYPIAAEAHLKMNPGGTSLLPTSIWTAIFIIDATAAIMVIKYYWYWKLAFVIFTLTSILSFSSLVYVRGVTVMTVIFSFWDVLILAFLMYFARKRQAKIVASVKSEV